MLHPHNDTFYAFLQNAGAKVMLFFQLTKSFVKKSTFYPYLSSFWSEKRLQRYISCCKKSIKPDEPV